jgi:hypothetical protein
MLKALLIHLLLFSQQQPESFTGIEYFTGTDSMKVTVRINYDLFLHDYQQSIFDDLDIHVLRSFNPFPADLANHYLNSKLRIMADSREVIGKLQKMEKDKEDVRFILIYRVKGKVKRITVRNTILTGLSSKAENLIIVKSGNYESTRALSALHNEETFILKKQDLHY